jgi:hypothetical protein
LRPRFTAGKRTAGGDFAGVAELVCTPGFSFELLKPNLGRKL